MLAALYFGIQHFSMSGMIGIVVVVSIVEKIISETVIVQKLGITTKDLILLQVVGKTALVSIAAGLIAFLFHYAVNAAVLDFTGNFLKNNLPQIKTGLVNFIAGSFELFLVLIIFAAIYLAAMNFWNAIDAEDKMILRNGLSALRRFVKKDAVRNPQTQN